MGDIVKKETEFSTVANDVVRFAEQIKNAGDFIPASLKGNAGAIAACILTGRELGLEPMASLRVLYVYKGHVGISGTGIVALLKKRKYKVEWPELTDEAVTVKITSHDKTFIEMSYTKKDAEIAGLWGKVHRTKNGNVDSVWKLHPKAMLRARCISNAAKAFAGEVLTGIYTDDEIEEIKEREEKPVNAAKVDSGVAALEGMLSDAEPEKIEPKENSEKPSIKEKGLILNVTEYDLILDEIEAACSEGDLSACADKISSNENLNESDKDKLRIAYQAKQKEIENERNG